MAVLKWSGLERFVAWLPMAGISGIGAVAALVLLDIFAPRLPVYPYWDWGLPPRSQVRWWRSSYTRSS
jgi:hypothetical protein